MSFTREQWARAFLAGTGNTNPSQGVVNWVVGWTVMETCTNCEPDCQYNLLNTHMGGWPKCGGDSGAVSSFPDILTGGKVNAQVLTQQWYNGNLYNALKNNNLAVLQSSAVSHDLSTWGTQNAAANPAALTSLGASHLSDSFSYGSGSSAPTGGGGTGSQTASPPPTSGGGSSAVQGVQGIASQFGVNNWGIGGSQSNCTPPSGPTDIAGAITYFWCQTSYALVNFGEHVAVFLVGLLLIGIGVYLIGHKQINAVVGQAAKAATKTGETAGEAALL